MSTVARLLELTAPFHRWVAAAVVLSFLTVAANVALMAMSAHLISKSALVTEVVTLTIAVTSVRVFAILRASGRYGERLVSHNLAFRVLTHLRAWFYTSIEPLAPARLSRYRSGDLLARSLADVETLEGFYVRVAVPPIAAALVGATACLFLALFDWQSAMVLLASLLLIGAVLPIALHRVSRGTAFDLLRARAELNALLVDQVQGVADLLIFDHRQEHAARVDAAGRELSRLQQRESAVRGATSALVALLASVAAVIVLALGVRLVASGEMNGVFLAVLPLVAIASFEAVQQMATAVQHLDASVEAGHRVFLLIDAQPDIVEPLAPATKPQDYSIEVRDLCFRYHPDDRPVLDGLSFEIRAGEKLALAGGSGTGKSTVVNLLLRFWEYESGDIRLGGRDLREYDGETIRSLLAVMPQDVHLFNTTLRDNLLVANAEATYAQIEAACRMTQLDHFIEMLPQGYETPVGENGLQLSGGERQRLALARAVLKDAPIVILDEPTANLDVDTERRLLASLESYLAGRTVLLISHRPAVWSCADRVIELENGRAVEVPSVSRSR